MEHAPTKMGKIHAAKSEIHSINFQDCHKFPWTPVIARGGPPTMPDFRVHENINFSQISPCD
jgi:hypothetical protein